MNWKSDYSRLSELIKSLKDKYHLVMILFVIHNDRQKMLSYLESKPEELVLLFNKKAQKLNFEFTGNILKIIDVDKVQKICQELENIPDSRDAEVAWDQFDGLDDLDDLNYLNYRDMIASIMLKIANIQPTDTVLDGNFWYGNILKSILKQNKNQVIYGYESGLFYDFSRIATYCIDSTNANLKHEKLKSSETKFDKALTIFHSPDSYYEVTDVDSPITSKIEFLKKSKESKKDIFEDISTTMSQLKDDSRGIFGMEEYFLKDSQLKDKYISNGQIDTIIQLGIETIEPNLILIIKKSQVRTDKSIRMINTVSKSHSILDRYRIIKLDRQKIDRVVRTVNKDNEYAGFVRNVPLTEISKNNYSLIPRNYIQNRTYKLKKGYSVRVDDSKIDDTKAYVFSDVAKIEQKSYKADPKYLNQRWLEEFIGSPVGRAQSEKMDTHNIRIPIVPLEQQNASVQKFDDIKKKFDNVNNNLDEMAEEALQQFYDDSGVGNVIKIEKNKNLPD
ncbi:N-6 DNA methylase [Companilactobacillus sp. HBUAS59699]|uniref:N-6 DNA methylase n=1 Tax=Companilactobacillus sp. HBUAS59699 TaxID=3109358 RepID=UPI002FF26C91